MSEEGGDGNKFLIFVSLGIANLVLGAVDVVPNASSQLHSWIFLAAGVGFLILAFITRYEDSGGFLDLS
jgi:hypothetical protein